MLFSKKTKANEWFYKAKKAYRKNKLPAPYAALFDYYVVMDLLKGRGYTGHYEFFTSCIFRDILDERVRDLRSILPEGHLTNFNRAYERFVALGPDPDYETTSAAFDELDDYTFEHYEELIVFLQSYIDDMTARGLLK
ncbi:MAG: hypothetical protein OSJ83_01875 [Clostridia bacterium]|nr:hypothetical protein [Clostridia bacterium]